jgi:hypothetical protein
MPPLRVVQWSTGGVGALALRAIASRPDLELVGVHVHTPEKVTAGARPGVLRMRSVRGTGLNACTDCE